MNTRLRRFPAVVLLFLFFRAAATGLYAQETEPQPESPPPLDVPPDTPLPADVPPDIPEVAIRALTPEQNRIDMDIRTSSLSELAAWCRGLGLAEGGTSAELARRLREYFEISEQAPQGPDNRKVITIESARSTEYFKIEAVDEDYARLSGDVRVNLKDGEATHQIQAWDILFNRTRNILTASGGVVYIKTEGETIETFRGESITVDLDNWSSTFLDGASERALQSDNTTYLFAGSVISKNTEDVTILNKASISSAKSEESLWSLNAARVWLLPGSDFAIFNALLKVGEIPVMYIPFFYYPADEVVFHPVIGYRNKHGNFIQTTTYLMGRPKADTTSESSLTRILGNSNDMEKKHEGLFLRSTGKKLVNPGTTSLRLLIDYYANLGAYLGTDFEMPAQGILGALKMSLGVGLSRTLYPDGNSFTPFFPSYDGSIDWNKSNLFSKEVPFRYRFETSSSLTGKYGTFSWTIPLHSDPFVDDNFLDRSESMDWVNMIQKGAAMDDEESTENQKGNYYWQLNGSLGTLPKKEPYITPSISSISSTMNFKAFDTRSSYAQNDIKRYSPSSFFYAPDTATLYSLSGSITGMPLTLGGNTAAAVQDNAAAGTTEIPNPLENIGVPRSPFETKEEEEDTRNGETPDPLTIPVLSQRFTPGRIGNHQFTVGYTLTPSSSSTLKFNNTNWKEYSDIDWKDIHSVVSIIGGDARLSLNMKHTDNFYETSFTYQGNGLWQQYSYLNEEADEFITGGSTDSAKINDAKKAQYRASFFNTNYNLSTTLRPLYRSSVFGESSLQYNLGGLAFRTKFDEENSTGEEPEWDLNFGEWNKEEITTHQFLATLKANVMNKSQSLSVTSDLPPRDSALTWNTSLAAWINTTTTSMRILFPGEPENRKLEPFTANSTFSFGSFGSFSQSFTLDTAKYGEVTSLTSNLNLSAWGITAAYTASRMAGVEYNPDTSQWVAKTTNPDEYTLQSTSFRVTWNKSLTVKELWNNRLQFTVNTNSNINFDLQRYTSSSLRFNLGFTLGIANFVDLSFSIESLNPYIYRYFKDMPPFNSAPIDIPDGPQNNFFTDLVNSFRFDDEELRKSSGFKLSSFRISATHYLGDWNAVMNWTMTPNKPTSRNEDNKLISEVSFLLQWIPISELKSDISYSNANKTTPPVWTIK